MKVLVVGGGGREHALAWFLDRSPEVSKLFVAPGNGGTDRMGANVPIAASDIEALSDFAAAERIDLTVVGPEAPLVEGIVDRFRELGLRCFGPTRAAAQLEGSKVFAKEFMRRHGIPTAEFRVFEDAGEAREYVANNAPVVIKADGLAAGKGVYVTETVDEATAAIDEIMTARKFGDAGGRVVVESRLDGEEVSVHAICSGEQAVLLPSSQDHKRVFEGDTGPNTGGMGAYAPVPSFGSDELERVRREIVEPTLRGMAAEGMPFGGVLYAGLMRTNEGPKVLEYNVRFGDPETQVLLPLLKTDLFAVLNAAASGEPVESVEFWDGRCAATVVVAAAGYPGAYDKGLRIEGLDDAGTPDSVVFHAGTRVADGKLITSGGRVLAVTAWGESVAKALGEAYRVIDKVGFEGAYYRKDIGHRAV